MAGRDDWMEAARAADDDELRERILTGFKEGKPFTPYVPTIALPAHLGRVLDFGCGLGRNFPFLATIGDEVWGFDLPTMIERCREATREVRPSPTLTDDWRRVSAERFDLVFASLVLQHIEPAACRDFLAEFSRLSSTVYLLTRADSDFGTNVLDAVVASERFSAGICVEVDHDPETNQLRVLGEAQIEDVSGAGQQGHFEVLLRSRR